METNVDTSESLKRKRSNVELNMEQKKEVLDLIDNGVSQRAIGKRFGVSKTTVGNIKRNRDVILKAMEDNCSNERKRKLRRTSNESVNILALKFFQKCRALNVAVTGTMLQAKAKEIAQRIHIDNFQASNGWLESFRTRNNINFKLLNGEPPALNVAAAEEWKSKLENVLSEYPPENQFNANVIGLFYRQMPRECVAEKEDKSNNKGNKLAKGKLSVLLCCSATGEKLKPLVVGNAARPRVFKEQHLEVTNLPVTWRSNRKASMTSTLFEEWLTTVNQDMKSENRRILLLVDNVTTHLETKIMSNVTVKFLPPNLASEVQILDQGIIRAVKARYHKKMLQYLETVAENYTDVSDFNKSVSVLHAIRWLSSAWEEVSGEIIVKGFHRAGLNHQEDEDKESEDDTDLAEVICSLPLDIQMDVVSVDEMDNSDVAPFVREEVTATPEDVLEEILDEFIQPLREQQICCDDESDVEIASDDGQPPSHKEALHCVKQLIKYSSAHQPQLVEDLLRLYSSIEARWVAAAMVKRQTKNNEYFGVNEEL